MSSTHIFFNKKFQRRCVSLDLNFNKSLSNDFVSFEQLGPDQFNLSSHNAKVHKIFLLQLLFLFWNIHFGSSFPWSCSVIVQRKLCLLIISFSKSKKHSENPYYPYFSWSKFLLLPFFFKTFSPTLSQLFQWKALESLNGNFLQMLF